MLLHAIANKCENSQLNHAYDIFDILFLSYSFLFEKKKQQVPSDLVTSPRNITGELSPPEQALHERETESSQLDTDIDSLNKALQRLSADPVSLKEETSTHVSDEEETEQHDEEKLEKFVTEVVLDKVEITTESEQVSDQVVVEENRVVNKMVSVEAQTSAQVLNKVETITEQVSGQVVVGENRVGDKMVSVEILPSTPVLDKVEFITEQVSGQVVVEENRVGDKMVNVEILPSTPVLDKVEIITEQLSGQVVVEENRVANKVFSVDVPPSAPDVMVSVLEGIPIVPVLDNLEIETDQVSDQLEVDEQNNADVMVSVLEGIPSVPVLDNLEIATDQVSDQLEVDKQNNADIMVSVLEGIPSVPVLDNLEIETDQVADQLAVDEENNADVMVSVLERIPSVPVLDNLEIATDQVSDQLEVEEESLLATGSVESLRRALDQLEMENGTDPMFSQLEGYQGFLCESMTVECCTPSFLKETTTDQVLDQVSCQLEFDEESLVDTGSIESLTAGFDETEDTAERGSSYVFETKTIEPTTPCLFSKAMQNTTDQVFCQFEVDRESMVETGSIGSLTAGYDEIEDTVEPGSSYVFETKTVAPATTCLLSKTIENTTHQVSCPYEVDGEVLVDTGSIKSVTAGFDEIGDTAEPGSSYFIETKTLEPNTPCLFSKEVINTIEQGPSLADVDEGSLNEIISVDTYTCGALVDETGNETEDDMLKGSDSMNDKAQLKEQIKVLQQQLYEVSICLLSFSII